MNKFTKIITFIIIFFPFFSCSHAEEEVEEFVIEIEHTDTIITNNSDSLSHDSTTVSPNDSLQNENNSISYRKDTIIVSYEKHMDLRPTITKSSQGAASYDKYLFQGYESNPALEVYDLENKTYLCKIDITNPTPNSKIHANSICFGNLKYSPNDFFPVLYVNSGYTSKINGKTCSFIYVYRIKKNDSDQMAVELVQTITLQDFNIWTEGFPDIDHNYLWIKYIGTFASFQLPRLEDGDVTISLNDSIQSFKPKFQLTNSYNQAHIYHNNKILLISGGSTSDQNLVLIIINILTQKCDLILDLRDIGLNGEPESIFFYKGQLMIGYRREIYKFNIRNISGEKII